MITNKEILEKVEKCESVLEYLKDITYEFIIIMGFVKQQIEEDEYNKLMNDTLKLINDINQEKKE